MALQYEDVKTPLAERFRLSTRRMYSQGIARTIPSDCIVPHVYKQHGQRIKDMVVKPDDVWVVTYPKCGTTWTQEMVWLIANDLDFERAKESLFSRFPFYEYEAMTTREEEDELYSDDTLTYTENMKSPRFIKSHLPKDLLPDQLWTVKPKIIYVAREAKDVAVSYFHHHKLCNGYTGTLEEFVEAFMADNIVMWNPFWKHILDIWKMKDEPYILFNTYEETKKDLPGTIRKTARFLGKSLTNDQVSRLAEHLDFKNMKNNPAVNFTIVQEELKRRFAVTNDFMRKGETGSGKQELSTELKERLDRWTQEKLKGSDYPWNP